MRTVSIIGATILAFAVVSAASEAEARGRRGGGSLWLTSSRTETAPPLRLSGHGQHARSEAATPPRSETAPAPLMPQRAADATAREAANEVKTVPARDVRVAEPWCATKRVVGSGVGFCVIN